LPHYRATRYYSRKAVIASGTVDSYVEKFLLEDGINVKRLPADQLAKIKRYLEMFSEL